MMRDHAKNNLFWRLMKTERSSAEGHEDFVTEALAVVLNADQKLTRYFLQSLVQIDIDENEQIVVQTQSLYESKAVGSSSIDLELRSESVLLFVENKISASLNKYLVESEIDPDGKTIDQIEKYDVVLHGLDNSHPSLRHLIAIGQEPLKQPGDNLLYFRRDFLWWDVYRIIEDHYASQSNDIQKDDYRRYLASEFLRFMQISHLDPPKRLSQSKFSVSDAVRLLAEAIRETSNYIKVTKAQNESGFKINTIGRNFVIWFDNQHAIRAFEEKVGGLKTPMLDESFWNADVSQQRNLLKRIIESLPHLEHDDSVPISLDDALAQFKNRGIAEAILGAILERWPQSPSTGKKSSNVKEISCVVGSITVRLAPYKSYERVILNTKVGNEKVHLTRRLLKDLFEYSEPAGELRIGHVNMPLNLVTGPVELNQLMDVIEQLACASNDGWLN